MTRPVCATTLALSLAATLAAPGPIPAQQPRPAGPAIPGAVTLPPAWLTNDAPFDLAAYFAIPPPDQNAAPLYLDALLEFSAEVAACFPRTPETQARAQATRARNDRLYPLLETLDQDRARVDRAAAQAVVQEFQPGFQKLGAAQRRPRCVFEVGISAASLIPHAQAIRNVVRVVALRTLLNLDRGDLDAPIADTAGVLRLCRDLQPRGPMICQLVSAATLQYLGTAVIIPLLSDPRLTAAQCDRLIRVLADHQARGIDGYAEGLKAEYLMIRASLHDLAGRPGDPDRAAAEKARADLLAAIESFLETQPQKDRLTALREGLPRATERQFAETVAALGRWYQDLAAAGRLPYTERLARSEAVLRSFPTAPGPPAEAIRLLQPGIVPLVDALVRVETTLHGLQALAAVRRWQIVHKTLPRDLAAACREAGLHAVPADPYSGQTLKLVVLDREPVVYAVGKDGKDDGGRIDNKFNTQPGDLTFRLAPARN